MADTEYELSRIDPVSLGKISGAIYGLMATVFSLMYVPFFLIGMTGSTMSGSTGAASMAGGLLMGVFLAVFMVVFYAVIGVVFGAITGFVYNFAASRIGGVEFEYRETE